MPMPPKMRALPEWSKMRIEVVTYLYSAYRTRVSHITNVMYSGDYTISTGYRATVRNSIWGTEV